MLCNTCDSCGTLCFILAVYGTQARKTARTSKGQGSSASVMSLASKTTAAVRVSFSSLMVQREQWDTYWGPKKLIFLIREIDDPTRAAAPVEFCQFVVLRSPRGRLGWYNTCAIAYAAYAAASRVRYISHGPLRYHSIGHDLPKISIQSSLESPKLSRLRPRELPDPRSIPEGVREPIYIRKK